MDTLDKILGAGIIITIISIVGWIANFGLMIYTFCTVPIATLIYAPIEALTIVMVLRIVGVLYPPVGVVMGFVWIVGV